MKRAELGDLVKCKVTGFEGVVTSYAKCLTGCDRITVQPPISKEGKMQDCIWLDVDAVEVIKKNKIKQEEVTGEKKGGWPSKVFP